MKLSTLVHYLNHLDILSPKDNNDLVNNHLGPSLHFIDSHELKFDNTIKELTEIINKIHQGFVGYSVILDSLKDELKKLISDIEPQYFAESYRLYEESFKISASKKILDREPELLDEAAEYLHARISKHGHWQHAGMIIRPGSGMWTDDLVACDPLYLVDRDMDLLRPTLDRYNEQYRRRLRTYFLNETGDGQILQDLPDGQFGFCLVYFFFNFAPIEVIKNYLTEIYTKLKPGGSMSFTFNNCDLSYGIRNVERNLMCYTPGRLLSSLSESLGYEVAHIYQIDGACAWMELKKPGTLTTFRGGQSLAEIRPKSEFPKQRPK